MKRTNNKSSSSTQSTANMVFELLTALYQKVVGFLIPHPESIYFVAAIRGARARWAPFFEAGTEPRPGLRDYLLYFYCLVMAVRYQISSFILTYEEDPEHSAFFRLDVVMEAVHVKSHFDRYAFLLSSFLLLYAVALHYQRNFINCRAIIEGQYRLVVGTLVSYWNSTLNSRYRVDFGSRNVLRAYAQLVGNGRHIVKMDAEYCQGGGGGGGNSSEYHTRKEEAGHQQRKLVALILKVEQVNLLFFVFHKLLIIGTALSYTSFAMRHRRHYHAYQYLFIFVDRVTTMSVGTRVIQNQFTGIFILLVIYRVYGYEYRWLYKELAVMLRQLKLFRAGNGTHWRGTAGAGAHTSDVTAIRARHTHLSHFINTYNHVVASRELYIFVLFNIPFNIYITTRIIFAKTPQALVLALTIFQVVASLVSALPMLKLNKLIHRPAELLPAIQEKGDRRMGVGAKLKLLTFYEQIARLDTDSAIGLTIGPLGILTKFATFKFIIFYIIYAIFSCSIIRKF